MRSLSTRISELSPEQLRALVLKLKKERLESAGKVIPRRAILSPCPASANQAWLWSVDRLTNGNPAWNVFTGAHFIGRLDVAVLRRSLNEIIKRHEVLRTALELKNGQLWQNISADLEIELPLVELRDVPQGERLETAQQCIRERFRQIFDLSRAPLIRPTLFRLDDQEYQMLVVMHHTITDWISFIILNRELASLYRAFSEGRPSPLPELPIHYGDYAAWEGEWLQDEAAGKQLGYWRDQLKDAPTALNLPYDHQRPPVQTYWGARSPVTIRPEVSEALKLLSHQEGATPFMTTMSVFYLLLYLHSGQDEIVIGTPVMGRKRSEQENLIGLFLNHLALRVDLSSNPTFRLLLKRVRQTTLDGYANQDLPFGKVVDEVSPSRDASHNPIFQVMMFFLAVPAVSTFSSNLTVKSLEAYAGTSRYDLLLSLWDKPEGFSGFFENNTALFNNDTIARMSRQYAALAAEAAANPDRRLSEFFL